MNMRWAWTVPVLSTLATALMAGQTWAQGSAVPPQVGVPAGLASGSALPGGTAPVDPAMLAAMQAQYYGQSMLPAPGGYPPGAMFVPAGAYPQAAMYQQPAMYMPAAAMYAQAAYMGGEGGLAPQAPGQFPVGPAPDVYGAYGYASAQNGAPGYGPPGYGPGGPAQPGYDQSGYGGQAYGGPGMMDGPCPQCGGQGCDQCRGGMHGGHGSWLPNGLLGDVLGLVAPYPDGGCAAVRWFDFSVDYLNLKRDNTGRSDQVFATFGQNGTPALTANDLDFGSYKSGFRFSGAFQVGPANSLEFTYFGQFNYDSTATARSANDQLFSVFSGFGLGPFFGFAEFDNADFQQLDYTSQFDSFEVNWRNRWMAPNCRYQGSWTLGVRHFILDEKLRYASSSSANGVDPGFGLIPARGRVDTDTTNNLTGIQLGTDMWICVLPGLRAGGEIQAGVYGNHMNINTTIGSNQNTPDLTERLEANDVSFIGQINLLATYRINYQWTVRGGYQFLYVDGVALAPENFNPVPLGFNNPFDPRVALVNDNGNVFYHGWNVGLEFMW